MTIKNIKNLLEQALISDGEMRHELYEYELEDLLDELTVSLIEDKNEFIFAVTEHSGDVAMVLVEKSKKIYINESARNRLKKLWRAAYSHNMKRMIPDFAKQLNDDTIPINGVNTINEIIATV
ncbi:hypothetical protein QUF75_14290 [Desulfococcaceae bacterium HSG7]|nr:hypothetical protein [Desulfococcaceae bacterium HSG7]